MFATYRPLFLTLLALVGAVFAGFYVKDHVRKELVVTPALGQARSVATSFAQALWQPYTANLPRPLCQPTCPDFATLSAQGLFYFATTPLVRLRVLDGKGAQLLSIGGTIEGLEQSTALQEAYSRAAASHSTEYVVHTFPYTTQAGEAGEGALLVTFQPVSSATGDLEIIELATLLEPAWGHAALLQWLGAGFILLVLALLVGYERVYSEDSEKIIEIQHEEQADLVAAKVKAEEESVEKSKFLANVSHELRTPLNSIIGFSEILKDEVMGPLGSAQYKEYATDIHASGTHLLSLINDILDFSKADANKLEVERQETDITKLMQNCLRLIAQRAENSGVDLVPDFSEKHVVSETDPKRLKQIVLNLLTNAVKFTPPGGKVTLGCAQDTLNGKMHIYVRDTGVGIAEKDISKVMAPFGQVKNEYSSKSEGTGLGLPLTRKLVELMDGHFHISSRLGEGTTVTLTFPLPQTASNLSL